jgi:hypothetical protein
MPKGMREKMHAKEHEEKKRKERKKDSPYFQIKSLIQIERESRYKEYKNI